MAAASIDAGRIGDYVSSCQTADGGFFFAHIPPSGAADTYHAVRSLRLLGRGPRDPDAVRRWLRETAQAGVGTSPAGIFYLVEAGLTTGLPLPELRSWAGTLYDWVNPDGGFGAWRNVDVEVSSGLETTYRASTAMLDLGMELDRARLSRFLRGLQNADGGFGTDGLSTLASTYYAVQILARLGLPPAASSSAAEWLRRQEEAWDIPYLEHLYWLAGGLNCLNASLRDPDRALRYALACQRQSGGFARARFGIATLQYTHYALEALSMLGGNGSGLRLPEEPSIA